MPDSRSRDHPLGILNQVRVARMFAFLWITLFLFLQAGLARAETDVLDGNGSIRGGVKLTKKLPAQRMRFRLYPGFKPVPPPITEQKRDDEWQNIVIYLKSVPSIPMVTGEGEDLQMVQLGESFMPHVLPIVKGSTVRFPNEDPIFHNVFSLSGTKSFDLGRYPKGDSRSVAFDEVGIVPVFCHLHSDMSAIILVLDNPYFVVPDPDGQYQIENIPAGSYTLVAWHERSTQVEQQVEVKAGHTLELDITVPIEDDEDTQK